MNAIAEGRTAAIPMHAKPITSGGQNRLQLDRDAATAPLEKGWLLPGELN